MLLLPTIEIEPPSPPNASVIWLHGLGAEARDFVSVIPKLELPKGHGVRFIFPQAPEMSVTSNYGLVMPAWYDILERKLDRKVNVKQLEASAVAVHALIDREIERGA